MSVATPYHVSLLLENGELPGMQAVTASVEKLFAAIAEVRKGIRFDLTHADSTLETPNGRKLSDNKPYKAHAAISCVLSGAGRTRASEDVDIRVSCFSLPSPRPIPSRQTQNEASEDMDVKVVFLDRSPYASHEDEHAISDDEARRLTATCCSVAKWSDTSSTLLVSGDKSQSGTFASRISILAPRLMVGANFMSAKQLLAYLCSSPCFAE
jgi:hypothetical protein